MFRLPVLPLNSTSKLIHNQCTCKLIIKTLRLHTYVQMNNCLFVLSLFASFIVAINVSKRVTLSWRKTDFSQSIWPAGDRLTTAFTILALNTSSWKGFWSKGGSSHFENFPSFQISWICSDVFQINEKFIHNCPPCLLAEMAKVASSVARSGKCFITWLCLTRTGNYQIHEFDWLNWILTAV